MVARNDGSGYVPTRHSLRVWRTTMKQELYQARCEGCGRDLTNMMDFEIKTLTC